MGGDTHFSPLSIPLLLFQPPTELRHLNAVLAPQCGHLPSHWFLCLSSTLLSQGKELTFTELATLARVFSMFPHLKEALKS